MKYFLLIFFSFISFMLRSQNAWDYRNTTSKNSFTSFKASIDSVVYDNASIRGKIVLMSFWRSDCPPCVAEIEALNALYEKLKDDKRFELLSFTSDDPETIDMLIDKYHIKYTVLSMPAAEIKKIPFVKGFPSALILNEAGEVIWKRYGGSTLPKEAAKIVKREIYPNVKAALEHKELKHSQFDF